MWVFDLDTHRFLAVNAAAVAEYGYPPEKFRGLRRHGYTVLLARHAADAVKLADMHGSKIDLLLTDIVMPGVDGRALAERLLNSTGSLKVLYTSGYTDSVATLEAIRSPSANFIQKPYSPDAIARKVRSVLDTEKR
jgi:DNA-binding NtrC family response regulator